MSTPTLSSYKPLPKQQEAYYYLSDDVTQYPLYGGGAGGGKSWLGCEWLMLCGYHFPNTRWFIGREEIKKTKQSVLITWRKVTKFHGFDEWSLSDDGIQFENGSTITFLDLTFRPNKDPLYERFGSLEFTGGWIEEAGEVNFGAFDTLKSRVGRHLNEEYGLLPKILITCNPKKNWLYKEIWKPWKNGELDPKYAFIPALATDNDKLPESYHSSLDDIQDPARKARLKYGDWEYDDDPNALVSFESILDLFTNKQVPEDGNTYIVADVALQGSDRFVVGVWKGFVLVDMETMEKSDGPEVINLLEKMKLKHSVPNSRILVDSDGVGAFVSGFMKNIVSFYNGSRPLNNEKYENLKTQCAYKLADNIEKRAIFLRDIAHANQALIIEELEQLKSRDPDNERTLRMIRKEDIKRNIKRSPDFLDMMIMRMYFELVKEPSFPSW